LHYFYFMTVKRDSTRFELMGAPRSLNISCWMGTADTKDLRVKQGSRVMPAGHDVIPVITADIKSNSQLKCS
jgi:hypothetical protein